MRLLGLRTAKEKGCPTFISIEPWIKGVTDPRGIIEATRGFCDFWIVGSHNRGLRPLEPDYYRRELPILLKWLEREEVGQRVFLKRELRRLLGSNDGQCR
jgi:DNA repair photolyase